MSDFYFSYPDRLPILRSNLTDDNGYIDLTTASSVSFIYQIKSRASPAQTGSASIISAVSGLVEYQWGTGEQISGAVYYGQWRASFSNGKQLSFPNDGYIVFNNQNRL